MVVSSSCIHSLQQILSCCRPCLDTFHDQLMSPTIFTKVVHKKYRNASSVNGCLLHKTLFINLIPQARRGATEEFDELQDLRHRDHPEVKPQSSRRPNTEALPNDLLRLPYSLCNCLAKKVIIQRLLAQPDKVRARPLIGRGGVRVSHAEPLPRSSTPLKKLSELRISSPRISSRKTLRCPTWRVQGQY